MTDTTFDVVVVGGGSSGAVVAARLAERGVQVALLEAGPDHGHRTEGRWPHELLDARALALTHDWGYRDNTWTYERARVIGGCSAHNGAIAAVGHRRDYDDWGLDGWFGVDVAPLFAAVVEKMRVRAYRFEEVVPYHAQCIQAAEAVGWTIASDLCDLDANESFGLETVNIVDGVRWNTSFAYLDPMRSRTNLRIVGDVLVDRVVETPSGVVIHAEQHGERVVFGANRVVVAAGVYGSPAILQRSGIGDPARLRSVGVEVVHARLGVGANLHDHPMVTVDRAIGPELQKWIDSVAATGFLPEEQTLGKVASSHALDGIFDTHVYPVLASNQTSLLHGRVAMEVACVSPRSRGRVDITSADPSLAPHIDHRYLGDATGHDLAVLREGVATANKLFAQPMLRTLLGGPVTDLTTDDAIRACVHHYYHPVGTCRMGPADDPLAVCDAAGRVHGLTRVVVADASLMPQIPRANTNLPSVMIGERIAAQL